MNKINKNGFGILESVVGMSIGLAGMMLLSAMLNGLSKGTKNIEAKNEFASLVHFIQGLSNENGLCKLSFWNSSAIATRALFNPDETVEAGQTLTRVLAGTQEVLRVGRVFNNLTIESLSLVENDASARVDLGAETQYRVRLIVTAKKKSFQGSPNVSHSFPLYLTANTSTSDSIADHSIVGCSSAMRQPASLSSCPSGEVVSAVNFEKRTVTCSQIAAPSPVQMTGECGLPTKAEECKYAPQIVQNSDGTCWAVCVWKDNYVWYESKDASSVGAVWSEGKRVSKAHTDQDINFYLNADDTMCIEGQAYGTSNWYRQCYSKTGTALSDWQKI